MNDQMMMRDLFLESCERQLEMGSDSSECEMSKKVL